MNESASKKVLLPKKLVPGVHTAIPLNGKTLQLGLRYKFAKTVTINCPDCKKKERVMRFTEGKLEEILPDGALKFKWSKVGETQNVKHSFTISKRRLQRLRF